MTISSSEFQANETIPTKYTCDGEDINPPLEFSDVPESAKSLALIVDDPDAPGGTWTHWILWDIDSKTAKIEENTLPKATQGITSFGDVGYGGPCPPAGTHRYFFKLYALDVKLDLPGGVNRSLLEDAMKGHVIEEAQLIGLYSRT